MAGFMKNLNLTARCSLAYRDERLADFGLGDAQFAYLLRVCSEPGITQEQLSKRLCIHKSNVARQVAALEERGLISRREEEGDRRLRRLYPTERAEEILPEVRAVLRAWREYLTADLTDSELALLSVLMDKVSKRAVSYFESGKLSGEEEA